MAAGAHDGLIAIFPFAIHGSRGLDLALRGQIRDHDAKEFSAWGIVNAKRTGGEEHGHQLVADAEGDLDFFAPPAFVPEETVHAGLVGGAHLVVEGGTHHGFQRRAHEIGKTAVGINYQAVLVHGHGALLHFFEKYPERLVGIFERVNDFLAVAGDDEGIGRSRADGLERFPRLAQFLLEQIDFLGGGRRRVFKFTQGGEFSHSVS